MLPISISVTRRSRRVVPAVSALGMTVVMLAAGGCAGSAANQQAKEEPGQTTTTAPDDRCDQDLMVETNHYEAESLDQAVDRADEIIEGKIVDLTTSEQRSDDDGGATTSYTVTVQVLEPLKGTTATGTELTSVVASDIANEKGEVVTRIGDHRLGSLAPGTQVILFITKDLEGFVIQTPGPAVISDGKVELGTCDLDAAERAQATTITAINGTDVGAFRSAIADAQR